MNPLCYLLNLTCLTASRTQTKRTPVAHPSQWTTRAAAFLSRTMAAKRKGPTDLHGTSMTSSHNYAAPATTLNLLNRVHASRTSIPATIVGTNHNRRIYYRNLSEVLWMAMAILTAPAIPTADVHFPTTRDTVPE